MNGSSAAACFLFSIVAICPSLSYAQQTVFGLTLDAFVKDVPECPYRLAPQSATLKLYDYLPSVTCLVDAHPLRGYNLPVRTLIFGSSERPPMVRNSLVFLLEPDGLLQGVHFLTDGLATQELVLKTLVDKYGQPTNSMKSQVKNLSGGTFESISAEWKLPGLLVRFDGTSDKLTTGEVFIDTPAAFDLRKSWRDTASSTTKKL